MNLKSILKRSYHTFFTRVIPNDSRELKNAIGDSRSLLDVGCGESSPIRSFSKQIYCVGVDAHKLSIEKSKKQGIHNQYFCMDILNLNKRFKEKSFDCVLASDVIEHFEKEEGLKLIKAMEKIAKRKVIIFTPNGFLPQQEYGGNRLQEHKSGWTVIEMEKLGYKVIGINGWKALRDKLSLLKYRPYYFWLIVSDITQLFTRNHPSYAFQLLCVKNIDHLGSK